MCLQLQGYKLGVKSFTHYKVMSLLILKRILKIIYSKMRKFSNPGPLITPIYFKNISSHFFFS